MILSHCEQLLFYILYLVKKFIFLNLNWINGSKEILKTKYEIEEMADKYNFRFKMKKADLT